MLNIHCYCFLSLSSLSPKNRWPPTLAAEQYASAFHTLAAAINLRKDNAECYMLLGRKWEEPALSRPHSHIPLPLPLPLSLLPPISSLSTQAGGHGERLCRLRTRLQLGATATGQRAASVDIPELCTLLLRDRTTGIGHRAVQSLHEPRPRSAAAHRSKSTTTPARPVAARCGLVGLVSTQSKKVQKEEKEGGEN